MARRRSKTPARGAQALASRVDELCGPELLNFMRDTLGVEAGVAEQAIRARLMEEAQEVFIRWAKAEMELACGLARRVSDAEDEDDDEE